MHIPLEEQEKLTKKIEKNLRPFQDVAVAYMTYLYNNYPERYKEMFKLLPYISVKFKSKEQAREIVYRFVKNVLKKKNVEENSYIDDHYFDYVALNESSLDSSLEGFILDREWLSYLYDNKALSGTITIIKKDDIKENLKEQKISLQKMFFDAKKNEKRCEFCWDYCHVFVHEFSHLSSSMGALSHVCCEWLTEAQTIKMFESDEFSDIRKKYNITIPINTKGISYEFGTNLVLMLKELYEKDYLEKFFYTMNSSKGNSLCNYIVNNFSNIEKLDNLEFSKILYTIMIRLNNALNNNMSQSRYDNFCRYATIVFDYISSKNVLLQNDCRNFLKSLPNDVSKAKSLFDKTEKMYKFLSVKYNKSSIEEFLSSYFDDNFYDIKSLKNSTVFGCCNFNNLKNNEITCK